MSACKFQVRVTILANGSLDRPPSAPFLFCFSLLSQAGVKGNSDLVFYDAICSSIKIWELTHNKAAHKYTRRTPKVVRFERPQVKRFMDIASSF